MSRSGVAFVTGGCSGIGLATATSLARVGHPVGILDRSVPDGAALLESLKQAGAPAAHIVTGDLAAVETHGAIIDEIEATLGPVAILVNNAGVPAVIRGDLLKVSPEAFDAVMDINLRGTFFLTQAIAERMIGRPASEAAGARAIVTISSVSSTMVSIERGEYCLSKSALPMLVQLFAVRLAAHGIGVFEVRPGIIRTPMTSGVASRYDGLIAGGLVPAGRWGEADDVARAVTALVGSDLSFATGSVITADGGLSLARL